MKKTAKFLALSLIAVFALFLVGCKPSTEEVLETAKTSLEITYATGDTATSVTGDLTLPTADGDVVITWSSSNTDVIANDGTVTRDTEDNINVTLTATLTYDETQVTKTFDLTVIADTSVQDALDAAESALVAYYADTLGSSTYVVTGNLTLVSTIGDDGATVTWTSSNVAYVALDGTVTMPTYTAGDQNITLTATISYGGSTTQVTLFAYLEKLAISDAEKADQALTRAVAFPANDGIYQDVEFVDTALDDDGNSYDITWTTSDLSIIAADGTVTQPLDNDTNVVVTASVTIGGVAYEKTYTFIVLKLEFGTEVTTIAAGIALGEDVRAYYTGMTVISKFASGNFFFTDGTDIMYAYYYNGDVEVGGIYNITGVFQWFYNSPELNGEDYPLVAIASTGTVSAQTPIVATVTEAVEATNVPSDTNKFVYQMYTITGRIYYDSSLGNYGTFLVPLDYDFNVDLVDTTTYTYADDCIMIYYQSDDEVLQGLNGQEVTLDIMMYGWRSDKYCFYANFFGTVADVTVNFDSDQAAVDSAIAYLETVIPTFVLEDVDLALPSTIYGVATTYVSSDPTIVSITGLINVGAVTSQTAVTLTATVTSGEVHEDVAITIYVGDLTLSTIADVHDDEVIAVGDLIKIQGIVTAKTKSSGFWIQDATGGLNIYAYSTAEQDALDDVVGQEVIIYGEKDYYNGLYEIKNIISIEVINAEPTAITPVDLSGVDIIAANVADYQGELVSFDGYVLKYAVSSTTSSFNFYLINLTTGSSLKCRVESSIDDFDTIVPFLTELSVGDPIDVVGGILNWYSGPEIAIASASNLVAGAATVTDTDLLNCDATKFVDLTLEEDYTLPTLIFSSVTAVTISAELQSNMSYASSVLSIVRPDDADVSGTVTYTLTLNETTLDVVVNATVKMLTEAEKLAAAIDNIPTTIAVSSNYVIPTTYGSTYSVFIVPAELTGYVNPSADGTTLEIVRPAGTSPATGIITFRVTVGSTFQEITMTVNVIGADACSDLFFSEYIEGLSNNKALEIYNGTGVTIDLSAYSVYLYSNGSTTAGNKLNLTGTLAPGEVFVIANSSAAAAILAVADVTSTVTYFNGDDAIALLKDGVVIDVIGVIGTDPGTNWTVNDGSTLDHTLVRASSVTDPNTTFTASEWVVYPVDTFTYLGSYVIE